MKQTESSDVPVLIFQTVRCRGADRDINPANEFRNSSSTLCHSPLAPRELVSPQPLSCITFTELSWGFRVHQKRYRRHYMLGYTAEVLGSQLLRYKLHFELPVLGSQILHCKLHFELPVLGSQLLHCKLHFELPVRGLSFYITSCTLNYQSQVLRCYITSCTLNYQSWVLIL